MVKYLLKSAFSNGKGLAAKKRGESASARQYLTSALGQADQLGTLHLAALIRLWLAPLLPPSEARRLLNEARQIAETSGRNLLLEEIHRPEVDSDRNSA